MLHFIILKNKIIERYNGILFCKLKKMTNFTEIKWNKILTNAVKATNIRFSRAIGMSPFYATFGIFPTFKLDKKFIKENKKHPVDLNSIHYKIRKHLKRYRQIYNSKVKDKINLGIGDEVWY